MFPGLFTLRETCLGNIFFLVCRPSGYMARKYCFLICLPSGNLARKQYFLLCPSPENMVGGQFFSLSNMGEHG